MLGCSHATLLQLLASFRLMAMCNRIQFEQSAARMLPHLHVQSLRVPDSLWQLLTGHAGHLEDGLRMLPHLHVQSLRGPDSLWQLLTGHADHLGDGPAATGRPAPAH